jgi:hypothetical protein
MDLIFGTRRKRIRKTAVPLCSKLLSAQVTQSSRANSRGIAVIAISYQPARRLERRVGRFEVGSDASATDVFIAPIAQPAQKPVPLFDGRRRRQGRGLVQGHHDPGAEVTAGR